jgi:hypothetical protein
VITGGPASAACMGEACVVTSADALPDGTALTDATTEALVGVVGVSWVGGCLRHATTTSAAPSASRTMRRDTGALSQESGAGETRRVG